MALTHIIAHRIQRQDPNTPSTLALRDSCWTIDGRIEECFRELKHCMMKRFSKEYGRFSDDHVAHPVSSWLNEYCAEKLSFESMTTKAMQHFKEAMDKTDVAMDGFIFFAYEALEAENFVHVFFVQHNTGQFIDGDIAINESLYLDTSGLQLAVKINLTDWQSGDSHRSLNAITLLRWRGEKDFTEVFVEFIGFAEKIDLSADTAEFLEVVSDYTKDLPEEVAHHTKKQVVDYCLEQDKVGKPVVIKELSTELKSNPMPMIEKVADGEEVKPTPPMPKLPEFDQFVSQRKADAKPELIPDKSQLRQFVRISGRDSQLSMSFSASCLGDKIVYDPSSDSLTIKSIPPSLKARLAKHFHENK